MGVGRKWSIHRCVAARAVETSATTKAATATSLTVAKCFINLADHACGDFGSRFLRYPVDHSAGRPLGAVLLPIGTSAPVQWLTFTRTAPLPQYTPSSAMAGTSSAESITKATASAVVELSCQSWRWPMTVP